MAETTPKRRPFQGGRRLPAKKKLFLASSRASPPLHVASEGWSSAENAALVEYVLFYGDPHVWPNYSSKDKIWEEAAKFINHRCPGSIKRTGICLAEDIFFLYHFLVVKFLLFFISWCLQDQVNKEAQRTIFFTYNC